MKSLVLLVLFTIVNGRAGVSAIREDNRIVIRDGDQEILRYHAEPGKPPRNDIPKAYLRGGYIEALFTPTGRLLTEDYPANHLHHHGVWSAWTKTEFQGRHPDFWNMGAKTGTVEFVAVDRIWQKDDRAGFRVHHRFVDLTADPPVTALLETWDISAGRSRGSYVVDLKSTQTCATASPLVLPEYRYGGVGFRGNATWDGASNCKFLTSSGETDRTKIDGSRPTWTWLGGPVNGADCGVYLLDHPKNFRFPQPVRVHPSEPFVCFAPPRLGGMKISPGETHISRHRLILVDGPPSPEAATLWQSEYAK